MVTEKPSICSRVVQGREVSGYAIEVRDKLNEIGGGEQRKLDARITAARSWLAKVNERRWRNGVAYGRIKRFIYLEQQPSIEEYAEINIAHARFAPDKIEANRAEDRRLYESIRKAIGTAERADPEFYRYQLEAMREVLLRLGQLAGASVSAPRSQHERGGRE